MIETLLPKALISEEETDNLSKYNEIP